MQGGIQVESPRSVGTVSSASAWYEVSFGIYRRDELGEDWLNAWLVFWLSLGQLVRW